MMGHPPAPGCDLVEVREPQVLLDRPLQWKPTIFRRRTQLAALAPVARGFEIGFGLFDPLAQQDSRSDQAAL